MVAMMAKRPKAPPEQKQMMPEPEKERLAADRQNEQQGYPQNNFAFGAAALVGLIALIVVLYVTGVLKP
jgi:hypothetical protein